MTIGVKKISDLTELSSADANDWLLVNDVDDTSDDGTGKDKKIRVGNLGLSGGGGGFGTDTSALHNGDAASGDLTGTYPSPTIAPGAVTLVDMANLPGNTMIGNNAVGLATPVAMSPDDVLAFLGLGPISSPVPIVDGGTGAITAGGARANLGVADTPAHQRDGLASYAALRPRVVTGTDYYIDSTAGNDGGDGLSRSTAWLTLANIATTSFSPGDRVRLKRGSVFTRTDKTVPVLTITHAGITLGNYGSGPLPIIDGESVTTGSIFNDGFESESSSFNTNWTSKTTSGSSTLTIDSSTPLAGTQSARYTHAASGTAYALKTFTAASEVYVSMRVNIETLVNGAAFANCAIGFLLGPPILLFLRHDGTPANGVQFELQYPTGASTTANLLPTTMNAGAAQYWDQGDDVRVEFHYKAATGATNTDGTAELWVDGALVGRATNVYANTTATGLRVGNSQNNGTGLGAGTVLDFDDVRIGAARISPRSIEGIRIESVNDVTIDGIEVRGASTGPLVKLRNSFGHTVANCVLHGGDTEGVQANIGGGNHVVDNTEIYATGQDCTSGQGNGVHWLTGGIITGENIVRFCHIHDLGLTSLDHGIYSEGGTQNYTHDNLFQNIGGSGLKTRVPMFGYRNRFITCKAAAAYTDGGSNVRFWFNSAYNCGQASGGNSPFVSFWFLNAGTGCELRNNIAEGSSIAIQVSGTASTPDIDYNCFTFSGGHYASYNGTNYDSLVAFQATGQAAHGIQADPLFMDPANGDLRLQGASPAFGLGATVSGNEFVARIPTDTNSSAGVINGQSNVGDATHIPQISFNDAGQLTAVTSIAISVAASVNDLK